MADITEYLQQILAAVRGEDVRQAIHDAIQACYTDGNWDSVTGAVDLLARQAIDDIKTHSGANFNETQLWPKPSQGSDGDAYYDDLLLELEDEVTNYDYIYVYYKPVLTGAPEIKTFRATDFEQKPVIIEGFYFDTSSNALTVRKMNITKASRHPSFSEDSYYADPKMYALYNCGQWYWNGSKNVDATMTPVTSSSVGAAREAGSIVRITGIKCINVT